MPEKDENGNMMLICPKCGYKAASSNKDDLEITEEIEHNLAKELTAVIDEQEKNKTLPTMEAYCKTCKKKQVVVYWQLQTRSADEAPTRFFRCTVCGTTWREYD